MDQQNPKKSKTERYLTIGIPSVKRQNMTYLEHTLLSLVSKTSQNDRRRVIIVVFLTDSNHTWVVHRAKEVYKRFREHVDSGFIQIVHPPHIFYPNFRLLERRFNDSPERVAWRSKQNLDYSYLMTYSQPMSKYYLQLEDDVMVTSNYTRKLEDFINRNPSKWLFLRVSKLGFIGLLFKNSDLLKVAKFLRILFDEKPCDLLINDLRVIKGQTKDIILSPSLFQHMGVISSLKNQIRRVKDNTFRA
ncbi:alpha-1,6-mannosyl-glycoprotein 4-beta-N-acetylglucosaminyltransferase-like [Saccostrea echinata]|uniref:alpha-1,6-mannosyl-glycoprotein 4-beta-N-acetylglucosaminyltransferase-like n=1 Tax=Saccostrea echinata TaxID=191078 RepID=UPI002A838D4C|nr:alpha-1,6-mannosyl-glycoprotein 4-beta-N-acetylglucosaminyltransferase-like [Saccostrea echinata]